jgi:D-alanine-D-alanine ligase
VAVIFGGRSAEHEVSCASAATIMARLDPRRYDVLPVFVAEDGTWAPDCDRPRDGALESILATVAELRTVDVVFPALHGRFGEDGTLQCVLDGFRVPYVGSGAAASAMGMDKEFTKRLLAAEGLSVADGVLLHGRPGQLPATVRDRLGLPVYVKPARAGSTIGVSRVDEWAALPGAVARARTEGDRVLVEEAVPGREVSLAVLEHRDGRLAVGPPADERLDHALLASLGDQAVRAFRALGCTGLLRVDFLVGADGHAVVNGVNTLPDLSIESSYARSWYAAGLDYSAVLDILIGTALARAGSAVRLP